jgi:hypothetical protein
MWVSIIAVRAARTVRGTIVTLIPIIIISSSSHLTVAELVVILELKEMVIRSVNVIRNNTQGRATVNGNTTLRISQAIGTFILIRGWTLDGEVTTTEKKWEIIRISLAIIITSPKMEKEPHITKNTKKISIEK